jgi:hypothetical protein
MATSSNSKVFVSPGVYTSEVDLSFVAQSVGVTTLGIVGETIKGPAFEPIFIRNFDEFSTFFGGTSPEKFINTQIPKYEAAYIAKSYLQQSNQLFVTRVLGLSGYDAGPSWSITTKANVDCTTIDFKCLSAATPICDVECVEYDIIPFSIPFTGCTFTDENGPITTVGITDTDAIPAEISSILNEQFELFDGSTSTINSYLISQMTSVVQTPSTSGSSVYYYGSISGDQYNQLVADGYTDSVNVYGVDNVCSDLANYCAAQNDPWYYSLFDNIGGGEYSGSSFYTTVTDLVETTTTSNCATFYNYSVSGISGSIDYINNTISVVLPFNVFNGTDLTTVIADFSACTDNIFVVQTGFLQESGVTENNFSGCTSSNVLVTYELTPQDGVTPPTYWDVCVSIQNQCDPIVSGDTGSGNVGGIETCYSGNLTGKLYVYDGMAYTDYDDLVIATFRSRGISNYSATQSGPLYEVNLTGLTMDCSGSYSAVTKNPFAQFGIDIVDKDGNNYFFETSFRNSDAQYISKVFGNSNFSKPRTVVPIFVEENYPALLQYAYRKGYIRGLSCSALPLPQARDLEQDSIAWYLEQYQAPSSPWVVSELRGNKVFNLFKFVTIADGDSANQLVKISMANMSFNNGTFDVLVRDFFDTDANPVVIEKFTNCNMNPNDNAFIAKKIGTVDGEYELNSKYIMIEINEDAPIDALPCGFLGYNNREYSGVKSPFPLIKSKYDFPGEIIYNPPFGATTGVDDTLASAGDNVRRTYLGISDTIGIDFSLYEYKGKQNVINACDTSGSDWAFRSRGFHMDINASGITIPSTFATSGTPAFYTGISPFTSDPESDTNQYYRIFARKFTLLVQGGFDGWDIYRESRTNTDRFKLGRQGYLNGASPDCNPRYGNATGWGAFNQIAVGDNAQDWANTDYYAYLLGQRTFANPEAVNINVFVTPGISIQVSGDLVEEAIEMIEFSRADSLYVCTLDDYRMFTPSTGDPGDLIYPQEAVDDIETSGIDSNYTATYYPWVLTRDSVNNTQIYLPPTAEVTRNLALTDNIAFPWFAAAGYTRGIVNAIKARKKLTQEDRDTLYQGRINPIATFSDVGTVIWGNKTLQIRQSALDRINVRRLLLQARKLISAVSVRLLFEQNDQKVRQDFLDAVNPILDAIRRDRGLYDFRVTVSSDAADLDRNQMTGKIYIKPTKSLEFIDITFYITPTGASFENI